MQQIYRPANAVAIVSKFLALDGVSVTAATIDGMEALESDEHRQWVLQVTLTLTLTLTLTPTPTPTPTPTATPEPKPKPNPGGAGRRRRLVLRPCAHLRGGGGRRRQATSEA